MVSRVILWPALAGLIALGVGLWVVRKDLAAARGVDKLLALRYVFFAAPLAVFGGEHLADARSLMEIVPSWMPLRLFWVYFVGVSLIAAATSLALKKYLRLSTTLLAIMFFLFVLLIHIPGAVGQMRERLLWTVALRDLTFGCGALALAASRAHNGEGHWSNRFIIASRVVIGLILIVFGVEHFLHPSFAPGVPLSKLTPSWAPIPLVWAFIAGTVLVVSGLCILVDRYAREAATGVGLLMTVLTVFLYSPILAMATGTEQVVVGINYVADTLLYGGAVLLLAGALPERNSVES